MSPLERITVNPRQCGGRPCIRGMRIRVTDVLDLLASGLTSSHPKTGVFALGMVQVEGTERSVMGSVPPALLQIRSDHVICSDMRRSRRHSTSEVDPPAPCFVLRRERFSPA
jgi:hypothetical protein